MNHFTIALGQLTHGRTQAELARISGIPRTTISTYISGERGISVGALGELLKAFPEHEQLELVTAHLLDEIPPAVSNRIRIKTVAAKDPNTPSPTAEDVERIRLFGKMLARAQKDKEFHQLVFSIMKLLK